MNTRKSIIFGALLFASAFCAGAQSLATINWATVVPGQVIALSGDQDLGAKVITVACQGTAAQPIVIRGPATLRNGWLRLSSACHIRFENLTFDGCGLNQKDWAPGTTSTTGKFITFKNCTARRHWFFVSLYTGNDDWTFDGCDIKEFSCGIYSFLDKGPPGAHRITVRNCGFMNIGTGAWGHKDGHAVGIQGGEGHLIENNYTNNTGAAVEMWSNVTTPMRNIIVRGNLIQNVVKETNTMGAGITISGSNGATKGLRTGIRVEGNTIINAFDSGVRSNNPDPVSIKGNLIVGCGTGLRMAVTGYPLAGEVSGNIVIGPKERYVIATGTGTNTVVWDYNFYWPGTEALLWLPWSSLASYKTATGFDAHPLDKSIGIGSSMPIPTPAPTPEPTLVLYEIFDGSTTATMQIESLRRRD